MKIIKKILEMQDQSDHLRSSGKKIAFVPTMGFLHEGHLELMRYGKKTVDTLVVSIFVNPTQFGPNEDFDAYPRDMEGDLLKVEQVGGDIVFSPEAGEMYPADSQTKVVVDKVTKHLCGLSRPGHFDGVTSVVSKLFNIVKPHIAIFGEKDYQQLAVIRRMVMDLNMGIEIVGIPTVRESDGLAMSSRNAYLNPQERASALCLKKALDLADRLANEGEKNTRTIKRSMEELILRHPFTEIDYVQLCDPVSLEDVESIDGETLVALAIKVGRTRLIDNKIISMKGDFS
ncbi:MAG: pantoate--beta-alanine ligase [Deltaproteobacteria bacterium]|nr:pantoate--beta-alanine ligase [Deltaproteobacteria bacterium]